MRKIKKAVSSGFLALLCCVSLFSFGWVTVLAAAPLDADGRYEVNYEFGGQSGIGGQMLKKYFDTSVEVEKIGTLYYLSVTQLSSSMQDLSLNLADGMQVGYRITENDGNRTTYSYTLSEENISKELPFSVYVAPRDETFQFTIKLDLSSASFLGDVDKTIERPAEFVPTLSTTAGTSYEVQKGQTFVLPTVEANLGEESVEVSIYAYYLRDNEKITVPITDNKILLENVGEYHVVYRASSERYLTSLGEPTYAEKDIVIISRVKGSETVKVSDPNSILPDGVAVVASKLSGDSNSYQLAAEKMKSIADRFQVFGVELIGSDGGAVVPSGEIIISIKADFTYDRNDITVYHLEQNGTLTKLSSENGGSYVKVTTDKLGTFVVCVQGVAFVMPIWGYILIAVGGIALVSAIVVAVSVAVKRSRKRIR